VQLTSDIVPILSAEDDSKRSTTVKISKSLLINKLNFINFQNDTILMNLTHRKLPHTITCDIKPKPCTNDLLECTWANKEDIHHLTESYRFENLVFSDDHMQFLIAPQLIRMDDHTVCFRLTDSCLEAQIQTHTRHCCNGIDITLIQNSAVFSGTLKEFGPENLSVDISYKPPQSFQWIDSQSLVSIIIHDKNETIYSGQCRIASQSSGQYTRSYNLQPIQQQARRRFKPKEYRSTRQRLSPSPDITFQHPVTRKIINLKIHDLSGLGFSVIEIDTFSGLLPGLTISDLSMSFANTFIIKCMAQIVYKKSLDNGSGKKQIKYGFTILDMDIQDHIKLLSLLYQAEDSHTYMCKDIDLEELWNFFFETGFIYPGKYAHIEANKTAVKQTYKKIYTQHPGIARHFINQKNGRILAHMATIRFYPNTWLIHHHASRKSESPLAGLTVLNQIGRFINDSHSLYSIHMEYLICYYRPDNKFPNRVFGGAQTRIDHPKGCSIDTFSYLHYDKAEISHLALPQGWQLTQNTDDELTELESFYENASGGLMLDAIGLKPHGQDFTELSEAYQKAGLKRKCSIFSLKKNNRLTAVLSINISDIGLNLSDLTSSANVIILDPEELTKDILYASLATLDSNFEQDQIPLLIYPETYAESHSIKVEKKYNLWVLNTQFTDNYFKFLNKMLRCIRY